MKHSTILKLAATALIVGGLAVMAPIGYYHFKTQAALAAAPKIVHPTVLQPSATLVTGKPVSISIPSVNISLSVIDGSYDKNSGEWTLTLDKAQFALPSVQPNNETGNTLIYGHYRPQVFAYLHHIVAGATATITTDNGYIFSYTFQNSEAFDPADTSIFEYKGSPRLTVQTCSGTYMQNRQMYYFSYDGYSKV